MLPVSMAQRKRGGQSAYAMWDKGAVCTQ